MESPLPSALGHEAQQGYVCPRCGWAFPNPHPSAKHRRAHKKHCGKIEGFQLLEPHKNGSGKASDDELSDDEHGKKPEVVPVELKPGPELVEKVGLERIENENSGSAEISLSKDTNSDAGGHAETDAVIDFPAVAILPVDHAFDALERDPKSAFDASERGLDSNKIDEHNDIEVQSDVPNAGGSEAKGVPLEGCLEINALDSVASLILGEQLVEGQDSKSELFQSTVMKVIPTEDLERESDQHTEIEVKSDVQNVGGSEEKDVPREESVEMNAFDPEASPILEEQLLEGQGSENELFQCSGVKVIPAEASVKTEVLDSEDALPQSIEMDVGGEEDQNELFCTVSHSGEDLDASSGAALMEDSLEVEMEHGFGKDNEPTPPPGIVGGEELDHELLSTVSCPGEVLDATSDAALMEDSLGVEMEHGLSKDNEPSARNVSVTYPGVVGGGKLDHLAEESDGLEMEVLDSRGSLVQEEESENELFSCAGEKDFPDETAVESKALELKASLPQCEKTDESGPGPENELFPSTGSCPTEINAGEISEMKHGLDKDGEVTELDNLSLQYAGEAGTEPDYLGELEVIPNKPDQSAGAMLSSMLPLHSETGKRTEIDTTEEDVECIPECVESDEMDCHPHITITESSEAQEVSLHEQPHEGINENEIGVFHDDAYNIRLEGHTISLVDPLQAWAPISNYPGDTIIQQSVVMSAPENTSSHIDSDKGQQGSVSAGGKDAIPTTIDQRVDDLHASNLAFMENSTDSEIQPMQIPQQHSSIQMDPREFQGEKINVEITEKAVKRDSDKIHTPLKALLAEAVFESRQKDTKPQNHNTLSWSKKDRSFSDSSSKEDHKEWNSPARLPITKGTKGKTKGKSSWVPFMCCSYINSKFPAS